MSKLPINKKIIRICEEKIKQKGDGVQVSFYAFFANKNEDPVTLMAVARWWIEKHELNHFEKATKIYAMVKNEGDAFLEESLVYDEGIQGLNHLTLAVSDLDKSINFYCDFLDFKGEVRWQNGAYLSYQNLWLCLSLKATNLEEVKPNQDYTHYAFSYDALAIREICQKESFKSVVQWQENTSEGDSLYIEDPDGHQLELHTGSLTTRLNSLKLKPYDGLVWMNEQE